MTASTSKSSASVGFLTVTEYEGQGLFGGYLLLNTAGRPLEFYCTTPVRPNRAQEILYGPTLKPYLYGEQIGQTLLEKAKTKPLLVFTDVEPVLAVREFVSYPVACVIGTQPTAAAEPAGDAECPTANFSPPAVTPEQTSSRLHVFSLGEQALAVWPSWASDAAEVVERWRPYATDFDVREPFQRIREAIDEARRSARPAA